MPAAFADVPVVIARAYDEPHFVATPPTQAGHRERFLAAFAPFREATGRPREVSYGRGPGELTTRDLLTAWRDITRQLGPYARQTDDRVSAAAS